MHPLHEEAVYLSRRTDYVIEVSTDGKTWTKVAERKGISGEDGAHVHALPQIPIQYVRVRLDGRNYYHGLSGRYSASDKISWIQLYK